MVGVTMNVPAMGGPGDQIGGRRAKVLNIDLAEQRTIHHIQPANALHIGQRGNMFDAARSRDRLLERSIASMDPGVPDGWIDSRIVSRDNDFLIALPLHI